ncbi:Outer membrane protein beta-barrel domain-containing protein [Flavobacterium sp. CF108]|uniref:outer membrane beta-barrel protein n=1 Tax=unclassified Flavobacterium TaxID=196869 RepID=UPI0008B24506|nr:MULTISPECIES: outer membrane beta-barrel protein [unclassified Flavobacterium]SEO11928.1 Outer membrane protein beta-barrel domain-containing protein [Flavobacterium sp. fv08]SHG60659.1 Outer membrane protein beta-barrel domain-containing protein [Flavobacterium sp. CF108]
MKKIFTLVGIALIGLSVKAQDSAQGLKGAWFATSQFGYQQTKTADLKNTSLSVLPVVGTFVTPSVAVGAGIGFINIKADSNAGTAAKTDLFVIQPLARKYWNVAGSLYFFGQAAVPVITGKEKESGLKVNQVGLSVSGGFDYFVTKNFSVEFSYDLANFTSTTLEPKDGEKTTVTNFGLAHVANVDPFYNTTLAGSKPNLTSPLSFGFKFIF